MTKKEAMNAARSFVRSVTKPDREWTLSMVESYLPDGYRLMEEAVDSDFFPVTISHIAKSMQCMSYQDNDGFY
jgi:hypothetical protein